MANTIPLSINKKTVLYSLSPESHCQHIGLQKMTKTALPALDWSEKGMLKKRFFIAAIPPKTIRADLRKVQEDAVNDGNEHWKWQHPDDYHISLAFPGMQDKVAYEKIDIALNRLRFPSFDAYIQGLRCFNRTGHPRKMPHVLWASLNPSADSYFKELHKEVVAELQSEGLPTGRDHIDPHITLAKVNSEDMDELLDVIADHDSLTTDSWHVDEIILYESHQKSRLGSPESERPYTEIKRYKLTM